MLIIWVRTQCDFRVEVVSSDEKTRVKFNYESLSSFDRQKTKWWVDLPDTHGQ